MPSRMLPTFPTADVAAHNTKDSCYVTIGSKVYDVTSFIDDHPGGGDLVLEYGGKDVKDIMEDEASHTHSESAYEILDDCLVGFVANEKIINAVTEGNDPFAVLPMEPTQKGMKDLERQGAAGEVRARENVHTSGPGAGKAVYASTGMSSEDDLSVETDFSNDYKQHKFLDLNKPLLYQVWTGGFSKDFYLEQVHRPRHYKGGESAPLFGNFLEPLSKTPWWVIPTVWGPCVAYGTILAAQHMTVKELAGYWSFGLFFWTLVEYVLHRCLFHLDSYLPDNRVGITLHFLLHGIHHYLPMDRLRLVMPPTLFIVLATPFWKLAHALFWWDWYIAVAVFSGAFPHTHRDLKKYHLQHHFADYENGFGVTSRFWDRIFGTELPPPPAPKVLKTI
ncbi:hypothetical protein AMS68_002085 [Peltaster fructicola]|uniref:Ceramide very long chain fatty acid hydroxylase n=1 Tax=Peltaster fructicola TaxID=286661 RepID=A0A6H0XPK7_9PEZI|nr:hypothetical protein AMS68_002085 [Peltaster fructicola]